MKDLFLEIAGRLMRCPAAPYFEGLVAAEAVRICREHRLHYQFDEFGNLIVRATNKVVHRPLILAAHMDHPGFSIHIGKRSPKQTQECVGRFHGGVGDSYFKAGTKLLLMPGRIPARLGRRLSEKERDYEIVFPSTLAAAAEFAVWDLPDFVIENNIIEGRVCDDLIGVASILTVLIGLQGKTAAGNVLGVLTRAEEVGFHGALALAESKHLPPSGLIISLETSRELPPVTMGRGVIIRVGDRASTFDSGATRFLAEVAADLKKRDTKFEFQRALMSGGTCEATAYQEYGYQCAAVCVALGNYHNCGKNDKIAAEFVSVNDALTMCALLRRAAIELPRLPALTNRLPVRLAKLAREARRELKRRKLPLP